MAADYNANEYSGYHRFVDEDGMEFGSFEVFWNEDTIVDEDTGEETYEAGWYWWACFPGCLPDGDASGPFETSREAWEDANNF